jgi:hypothetical protein
MGYSDRAVIMAAWFKKRWFWVTLSDTQGGSAPDSSMGCRGFTRGGFNATHFQDRRPMATARVLP